MQLRRSLRNRIGSFGLLALLGIVPAACGAEPAGGDGENWLQLAASNGTEDTSQGDTPPNIRSPYGAYLAGLSARRQGDLAVAADYMAGLREIVEQVAYPGASLRDIISQTSPKESQ